MNNDLVVKALDSSSLAMALLNTSNEITWSSPYFFELINNRKDLKQETILINLIKPLLTDLSFQHLMLALDSKQRESITCMCINSDTEALGIHFGEVIEDHRIMTIVPQIVTAQITNSHEIDVLTGLGNRIMFERILTSNIGNNAASKLAMIMIDLDHFKRVNDTLGHLVGDKLLKLVANRFSKLTRSDDNLIRLGGDEFILLIKNDVDLSRLKHLAQRFIVAASKTFVIQSQQINIGASIGIAIADDSYKHSNELYRHADLAMYESKKLGRSQLSVFNSELEQRAQYRRAIEIGLRRGLVKKEFCLRYIPQIDVTSNTLMGFETLLQWQSKELGLVDPERFLPIAEDIGEINKIGCWGIEQAIQQAKKWPSNFTLTFSISLGQLLSDGFASFLMSLLHEADFSASNLEISLSESTLMETKAQEVIKSLVESGVKLALNDPLARFESLRHLRNLPISRMRIHRDFMISSDAQKTDTIKSILDISEMLGIPIVAQGFENEADFWLLKENGFPNLQGFFTNSPLTNEQVDFFMASLPQQTKRD